LFSIDNKPTRGPQIGNMIMRDAPEEITPPSKWDYEGG